MLVNDFFEGVLLKYFLWEFNWWWWSEEKQASQTASVVAMELFIRLIFCLTQRKHRWEWRTIFAELHNVVCRWHRVYSHAFLRIDIFFMIEVYNTYVCAYVYWAQILSASCNLYLTVNIAHKKEHIIVHSRLVWCYVNQIIFQLNKGYIYHDIYIQININIL